MVRRELLIPGSSQQQEYNVPRQGLLFLRFSTWSGPPGSWIQTPISVLYIGEEVRKVGILVFIV